MTTDEYGEVLNSEETYKEIAEHLLDDRPVFVGWTDQEGSHFDILFTCNPIGYGTFQGGVRVGDIFVSVMRVGSFGFNKWNEDTTWDYYDEKIGKGFFGQTTGGKLAELINGVKKQLRA